MSTYRGSSLIQQQPTRYRDTPGRGSQTILVFKGPRAALLTKRNYLLSIGYDCEVTHGPAGIDELQATINLDASSGASGGSGVGFETPEEVWTLSGNDVEKDILESNIEGIADISQADKDKINAWVTSHAPDETRPTFADDDATGVLNLMMSGVKSVAVDQPILTGTYVCTENYPIQKAGTNIGKRFTNAQLRSLEGVPARMAVALPSSGETSHFTGSWPAVVKAYGWVKKRPTVEQVGWTQLRVSVRFEFGLWATVLYPDAS